MDATVAGLPAGSFGPFGNWAARIGNAFFCELWPSPAGNTPLGPGPLPDVPVLAVNGGFDMRTPTANAAAVISQFPHGQLVVVPGVGHSVATADFSNCAPDAFRLWILGTLPSFARATCPRLPPPSKILGAFPSRPGKRTAAATLAVVGKTLREAEATWWQLLFSPATFSPRGLYGGKLTSQTGLAFTVNGYSLAPGVTVTGKISFAGLAPSSTYTGTVKVFGPAAVAGTLKISKETLSGTLGSHAVKAPY
jgi:hypothetical protein